MTKHKSTEEIIAAIESTAGDITAAASLLGLRREAIHYRINREPEIKRIIDDLRNQAQGPTTAPQDQQAPAETETPGPTEQGPAGCTAPDQATTETQAAPNQQAETLPEIAAQMKRQDSANLSAYLKNYIAGYGLPTRYQNVIDYIKYLDKSATGNS